MYFYELISLKYMIKVIKKSKCLLITTALITLVSMHNRSEKKLYILYIIQYYNNQFHIIKKKLHLFIPIKKKITELHACIHFSDFRERFVLFKDVFLQQVTHDIQHYPTCFLTSYFTNLHKIHCPKKSSPCLLTNLSTIVLTVATTDLETNQWSTGNSCWIFLLR